MSTQGLNLRAQAATASKRTSSKADINRRIDFSRIMVLTSDATRCIAEMAVNAGSILHAAPRHIVPLMLPSGTTRLVIMLGECSQTEG